MMAKRGESAAEARARVQQRSAVNADAHRTALNQHVAANPGGRGIEVLAIWSTVVFVVAQVIGVVDFNSKDLTPGLWLASGVSLVFFLGGCGGFLVAIWAGAQRSRKAEIGIGGWFLLAGSAPNHVRIQLLGALAVQIVTGITSAVLRPFSPLAFGTLSWVWGLALCGIWGARYGYFPRRRAE